MVGSSLGTSSAQNDAGERRLYEQRLSQGAVGPRGEPPQRFGLVEAVGGGGLDLHGHSQVDTGRCCKRPEYLVEELLEVRRVAICL